MQSHNFFTFGPKFNIMTTSLFGAQATLSSALIPPTATYLITEASDFLVTENADNLIAE